MSGQGKPKPQATRGRLVPPKLARWLDAIRDLPRELADPASRWRKPEAQDPCYVEFHLLMAYRVLLEIARHPGQIGMALRRAGYHGGYLELDENRKLVWELDPLMAALVGVEVDRIRECAHPECRRIYWARRTDQSCCSKECGHALRSRNYRAGRKRPIVVPVKKKRRSIHSIPRPRRKRST